MTDQIPDNVPFFYEFQADFIILDSSNEIKFIKPIVRRYFDNNPILAREAALTRYQDFIEYVLQSIDKPYTFEGKARTDLKEHFNSASEQAVHFGDIDLPITKPISCKIGVYFINNAEGYRSDNKVIIDTSDSVDVVKITQNQEIDGTTISEKPLNIFHEMNRSFLIHGIEYVNGKVNEPLALAWNLWDEYEAYIKNNCDVRNYKTEVSVWSNFIDDTEEFDILLTPFDWEGYDEPHSTFGNNVSYGNEEKPQIQTYEDLIILGESKTREFKPAIFYNYSKDGQGSGLPCAKAICSFLNTDGGYLFIGVKNDGKIQGLVDDFSIIQTEDRKDGLLLELSKMVRKFFPPFVQNYISTDFPDISGKTILVITIKPAERPIFMTIRNIDETKKVFFFREFANNRELIDLEEIFNYIATRWYAK